MESFPPTFVDPRLKPSLYFKIFPASEIPPMLFFPFSHSRPSTTLENFHSEKSFKLERLPTNFQDHFMNFLIGTRKSPI
jgi:hypothetical protein